MKFSHSSKKIRTLFILSLSSLSTVCGSASAMQYIPVQGPQVMALPGQPMVVQQPAVQPIVIQQGGSNEVGKYKVSKQLAKNLKDKRESKVWTGMDTAIELASAGTFFGGNGYNVYNGNWNTACVCAFSAYEIEKAYKKNPFLTHTDDPTEKKTVSEWGITEETLAKLPIRQPKFTSDPTLDLAIVCKRSYLETIIGAGEDQEPAESNRLYALNRRNPATGQDMTQDDLVLIPKYSYAKINDKQITRWQAETIKDGSINEWPTTNQLFSLSAPFLALPISAVHLTLKAVQKASTSVGQVIDKQQDIQAMEAINK